MNEEIPIDKRTIPHEAIDAVIKWLEIGYETKVTRKSDKAKIVIRIISEEEDNNNKAELEMLRKFYVANRL